MKNLLLESGSCLSRTKIHLKNEITIKFPPNDRNIKKKMQFSSSCASKNDAKDVVKTTIVTPAKSQDTLQSIALKMLTDKPGFSTLATYVIPQTNRT